MAKQTTRVRRSFTSQFKRDAVDLVKDGKTITEVARSLGVARSLLRRWQEQLELKEDVAFPGHGKLGEERERVRTLGPGQAGIEACVIKMKLISVMP